MKNCLKYLLCTFWIFCITLPTQSYAGFDPCNWGPGTRGRKVEVWDGQERSLDWSKVCPPWNRSPGRGGCLKKYPMPGDFDMMYNKYCAEKSTQSTYFDPKIHVRIQTCNAACWTLDKHLSGDGQCMIFPGALGIPTTRLCARVAIPASPELGEPADHGYTYGLHLNEEGALKVDPIPTGVDGENIYYARPKVCAYWDPSVYDALMNYAAMLFTGPAGIVFGAAVTADSLLPGGQGDEILSHDKQFILATGVSPEDLEYHRERSSVARGLQSNLQPDLWDLNPVKQSVHFHEGGVFFVFELLIQLVKLGVGLQDMIVNLVNSLPDGLKYLIYVLSSTFWIIQALAIIGEEVMIPVLEYFGQFNNVVGAAIGCVLIPLGPFPPPYCPDNIPIPPASPITQEICKTTTAGTEIPDSVTKCIQSEATNNAIQNSTRIGFNVSMPICAADQTPGDICVKVHPTAADGVQPANASLIYAVTDNTGLLSVCDGSHSNVPCVESPDLAEKCAKDTEWCNKGIRLIYSTSASGLMPQIKHYYDTSMRDCGGDTATCQEIWGVNVGDFADLTVTFPEEEEEYNVEDLVSEPVNITKPNGDVLSAKLLIPREAKTHDSGVDLEPSNMYVVNQLDKIIGSMERAKAPKPTVYQCNSQGVNCTSHHLRPAMVVKLQVGSDSTKGALSTETYFDDPRPRNTLGNTQVNLAGRDYTSFVTDSSLTQKPFEGPRALNPSTIFGEYRGGVVPYDSEGNLLPGDHVYTGGLEYFAGEYKMGGELMCLSGYQFEDCFTSSLPENCVLTKFTNSDYVKCTDFFNRITTKYPSLGLCSEIQMGEYGNVETISLRDPVSGTVPITIKKDPDFSVFCYDYPEREAKGKLCMSSQKISDRQAPAGYTRILPDSAYYNYDKLNPPNPDILSVRNKTPLEHGLCVNVPTPPTCKARRDRYALWPETEAGLQATGQCVPGKISKGPDALKRHCTFNLRRGTAKWESLDSSKGCKNGCRATSDFPNAQYRLSNKTLQLTKTSSAEGIFQYKFNFEVDDISDVSRFVYVSGSADDSFQVKINGNIIAFAPSAGYAPGREFGASSSSVQRNVDLKRYLRAGNNEILVDLSVRGGGNLRTEFILEIAGCNNINISD